jgi:thioredoxin reductase
VILDGVIVVGAGAAGLVAAQALIKAGVSTKNPGEGKPVPLLNPGRSSNSRPWPNQRS